MALENGLLVADVMHVRLMPKKHFLKYKVYYLCFPISRVLALKSWILSINRFNLFSFYEKDHGMNATSLEGWTKQVLLDWNLPQADGDIVLLTMPRVLGYGFNPVSFWFCLDKNKQLRAVISEVNNTFGEKHCYLSFHEDRREIIKNDILEAKKVFHVSPFLTVNGHYQFRFDYSDDQISVWIDYYEEKSQKTLATSLRGRRQQLNFKKLLICFFRYPLITFNVIYLIHYHALRLILKRISWQRKPKPPSEEITK